MYVQLLPWRMKVKMRFIELTAI